MKFSRVIGKIDPKLVERAEKELSKVFLDLGVRYDNTHVGSGMGGDPLIFGLMYPIEHICTLNIPTAATDGKRYYWNPKFVLKQTLRGLRLICGHESWHALYMHPQRRGSRLPKLWNIAVDYIVNSMLMDDLKARKFEPKSFFNEHLGQYKTLSEYMELLKNPFGSKDLKDMEEAESADVKLPHPNEDRELTPEEIKELERREKRVKFFFADPDLSEDMRRPEKIYDMLYALLPKCPQCGSIGLYKHPQKGKKDKEKQQSKDKSGKKDKSKGKSKDQSDSDQQEKSDQHDHGNEQSCDCPGNQQDQNGQENQSGDQDGNQGQSGQQPGQGCPCCGDGIDIFDLGGTVDDHMDTSESQEKLAKRVSDAMEAAKKLAGTVPAALEDELGKLTAPKVTWQDIIRTRILKARSGNGRNDWTRFRTRPMFAGLMVPKRRSYYAHFGCLLDTSGSMSKEDMAFGISQLTALDERSEGTITCGDADIYWDKSTLIRKANAEELSKIKVIGRGGTMFSSYFTDYEKHIGRCDFLIVITDGFLLDTDVAEMKDPGIDVIWLITSGSMFNAPFGRVFDLRN